MIQFSFHCNENVCPLIHHNICTIQPRQICQHDLTNYDLCDFYKRLTKKCIVHNIFNRLVYINKNHTPDIWQVINTIKYLFDRIKFMPNIWIAFCKFTSTSNPTSQKNEQVKILKSLLCLIKSVNMWLETGCDFKTRSANEFRSIYRFVNLRYGCVAKMWNYLGFSDELESFVRNASNVLGRYYECCCNYNNLPKNYFDYVIEDLYDFPDEKFDFIRKKICEIKYNNWFDYVEDLNMFMNRDIFLFMNVKSYDKIPVNLFMFSETTVALILRYARRLRSGTEIYMDMLNHECMYELPRKWFFIEELIPYVYEIKIPDRCVLCDKKIKKQSTNKMIRLCDICYDITNNQHTNDTNQLFKFRHYRIIIIIAAISDPGSLFSMLNMDIISYIVQLMSRYRLK